MKKFLCVCNGGNCRSAALAEVLKGCFGKEAIAVGTYWFPRESIEVFADWSDVILVVEPREAILPEPDLTRWRSSVIWDSRFDFKRKIIPMGPDIWGHKDWDAIKIVAKKLLEEHFHLG